MLKNAILLSVSMIAIVGFAPWFLPLLTPEAAPPARLAAPAPPPPVAAIPQRVSIDHEFSIPADPRGQFVTDARLNGQSVRMMVDTGASFVTLSARVAQQLGLHTLLGVPHGMAQTANGVIDMTPVELSTITIGSIYMTNVRAYVLDAKAGEVNLIGANFLKQLAGVEQRGGWLYLRQ